MESYRSGIKFMVLTAAGVTPKRYERIRKALFSSEEYEYDAVDEVIVSVASQMKLRHQQAFALLYDCRTEEEAMKRMQWKKATIETYKKVTKKFIVDNALQNQPKLDKILQNIKNYEIEIKNRTTVNAAS